MKRSIIWFSFSCVVEEQISFEQSEQSFGNPPGQVPLDESQQTYALHKSALQREDVEVTPDGEIVAVLDSA